MQYTGSSVRLAPGDLDEVAKSIGVTEAHLRAVIEVETSGKGYDSLGHPDQLFEPHQFYAKIKGNSAKLKEAVAAGCAYPYWKGPGSYPKTTQLRWQQFQKAVAIDETAAISSASWGLGQIMGSEFDECGYTSPQEMVTAFTVGEKYQVEAMAKLIKHRGLDRALRNEDWATFALRYNGKAYRKNQYDTKLASAYARWKKRLGTDSIPNEDPPDGTLVYGMKGPRVKAAMELLKQQGYYKYKTDDIFGDKMRNAINAWKADNGIPLDGKLTPAQVDLIAQTDAATVDPVRATATAADLKDTSTIVKDTDTGKKVGLSTAGLVGGAEALNASGVLDQAQDAADKVDRVHGIWETVMSVFGQSGVPDILKFIVAHSTIFVSIAFVIVLVIIWRVQKRRVEMHQNAEVG